MDWSLLEISNELDSLRCENEKMQIDLGSKDFIIEFLKSVIEIALPPNSSNRLSSLLDACVSAAQQSCIHLLDLERMNHEE